MLPSMAQHIKQAIEVLQVFQVQFEIIMRCLQHVTPSPRPQNRLSLIGNAARSGPESLLRKIHAIPFLF
jgi:hypothetical protein